VIWESRAREKSAKVVLLDEAACGSGVCRVRAKFRFVIAISQQKVHRIEPVTGQWISEAIHARPLPS
jgi:hypothetical protein